MTRIQLFRKWISFLKAARKRTDVLGLIAVLALFIHYAPIEIFNANPATGGDTGSHYWPLVTLVKEGLPNWNVRVWNPGNLGGEPHLTHYFPLPYLFMALLSLFMPLGRAFNIGTFFPIVLFPVCVYFCLRGLKARFPIPILASTLSLCFLYNESFSMWGGNALSVLAGQFAHSYAYDFLLLGIGSLYWEMDKRRFPWLSLFLFAGVLLSHFYVALFLPAVFLSFLFCHPEGNLKSRFSILFRVGAGALLLSAWFVIPMLHNSKWQTAFGLKWGGSQLLNEAFPKIFWPLAALVLFFSVFSTWWSFRKGWVEREWKLIPVLIGLMAVCGIVFYFIFPSLGLVDIRVIPTLQLLLCLLLAFYLGIFFHQCLPSVWIWFWTLPLIALCIWWTTRQISNLPYWMQWNYSGWEAKKSYPDLQKISEDLRGDFSQGRVIYENSQLSNVAGSMRVFEMLPYFANRATMESLYMQSTVLAPEAFYLQALISKTPSCPFPNYQCTTFSIPRLSDYLQLMGVTQLILINEDVRKQADQAEFLSKRSQYGIWHLYDSKVDAHLVETLREKPIFAKSKDFKKEFYQWFLNYKKNQPFLIQANDSEKAKILNSIATEECHPKLQVDFNEMKLETDCPGRFHILKFAFHPTFETSSGDSLYLTSPGFIGVIPSQNQVIFRWGQHWLWLLSDLISWVALMAMAGMLLVAKLRRGEK